MKTPHNSKNDSGWERSCYFAGKIGNREASLLDDKKPFEPFPQVGQGFNWQR